MLFSTVRATRVDKTIKIFFEYFGDTNLQSTNGPNFSVLLEQLKDKAVSEIYFLKLHMDNNKKK